MSKQNGPFHCIARDYSRANCYGLDDHQRDVPWAEIFKLTASAATTEFCEQIQVAIDIFLIENIRLNLTDLHDFVLLLLLPQFIKTTFFVFINRINLLNLKLSSGKLVTIAKRFLKLPDLYANKTKKSITFQKLGSHDFWQIASLLNKDKSAIPPPFNIPEVLPSASDKAKLFAKNF